MRHKKNPINTKITQLYADARSAEFNPSKKLMALLHGDNSVASAMKAAQGKLANQKAAGDTIGNIDVINATKMEIDDQVGELVRKGGFNAREKQ